MNEIFEKIYNNNTSLNEDTALFEKVYMEVKMLNEMNPKLRALLAAGLIGTAGLGAASCSMPTDDPYDAQYTIEQPTPENPEEIEEIEDSEDSEEITDSEDFEDFEDPENPENPEDSENSEEITDSEEITNSEDSEDFEDPEDPENPEDSEYTVTFETLGIEEYAESLVKVGKSSITYSDIDKSAIFTLYRYKNADDGFIKIKFDPKSEFIDSDGQYNDGQIYICYTNRFTKEQFYVPVNMESDFDQAITAYKATYAE